MSGKFTERMNEIVESYYNAETKIRTKVVIICSLSSKDRCMNLVECFKQSFGEDIYHPFLNQSGSLFHIQKKYLKKIDEADFVIAIPNNSHTDENSIEREEYPVTDIISNFDESTSYEMAYARHIGKPVMILGEGWSYRIGSDG